MNHSGHTAINPLLDAARAVEARLERSLGELGLSRPKLVALTKLVEAGEPLTLGELAERISCVRSNITQLMDRLEADGLVRRVDDPADRRSVRAALTEEGKARQKRGALIMDQVEQEVSRVLPEAVRSALKALAESRA
jgi:DNA-binding MarR family transcriptional regulator